MHKYYYTCPIKAAYMSKEFSVKFVNTQPVKDNPVIEINTYSRKQIINLSILVGDLDYTIRRFGKVVVCEESEHIFEPQQNDVDNEGYIYGKTNIINTMTGESDYSVEGWVKCVDDCYSQKNSSKTYIKNNKHFFMPEVENE